jgi:hypothetical protein
MSLSKAAEPNMMKAPYPFLGGKSSVAHTVWAAFGNVGVYAEPFCGSAAVLLARPVVQGHEVVNDVDCMIANFWRAVKYDPDTTAMHAGNTPSNEADLTARQRWLMRHKPDIRLHCLNDPEWFDPKAAGWWVWGQSASIQSGWMVDGQASLPRRVVSGVMQTTLRDRLPEWFAVLSARLKYVMVLCHDWNRLVKGGHLFHVDNSVKFGIFLDPPYVGMNGYYGVKRDVWLEAAKWAFEHGSDQRYRIVLCGYEGSVKPPDDWTVLSWDAGGRNGCGKKSQQSIVNGARERLYLSPYCRKVGMSDNVRKYLTKAGIKRLGKPVKHMVANGRDSP